MLKFAVWARQFGTKIAIIRYTVSIASVASAFLIVSTLQRYPVRDPIILIYLAAIAVNFWRGQDGPGFLAFCLCTVCLIFNFLFSEHRLLQVVMYDFPTLCVYAVFAWWIQTFARSRRRLEQALRHNREELEATVAARTSEVVRVNTEYRRLLEENKTLQEKLQHENISLQERNLALQSEIADIQRAKFEKIIGQSPALHRTLSRVEQVATTDVTVLITGETGTGKELIAQAIHENSKRSKMPFRAINCAAFPTTLMASELFGHERGAFTGADRQRLGQFELASGGTLFLDEIAELPLETQAMLLRVLEEHSFERLGGTTLIRSDVRIIAATNRDLHAALQRGEFRQDLFFRLNAFRVDVPSLRERREDIPLLVQHFVQISARRHGKSPRHIEKRVLDMLLTYTWPGNIRELRNVIDTSVIISSGEDLVIDEELLYGSPVVEKDDTGSLEASMAKYEWSLIERALTDTHGRVSGPSGAATLLSMPASTLSARIRVLRIDVARFKIQPE